MRKTTLVLLLAAVLAPALFLTTCTMVPGSGDYFAYVLEGEWETVYPTYLFGQLVIEYDEIIIYGFSYYSTPFYDCNKGVRLEGYSVRTSKGGYIPHEGLMFIEDIEDGIPFKYSQRQDENHETWEFLEFLDDDDNVIVRLCKLPEEEDDA